MTSPAEIQLNTLLQSASVASNRLIAGVYEPLGDLGLSTMECNVLRLLWEADGLPVHDLAANTDPEAVLDALLTLERNGLVTRDPARDQPSVFLTEKGHGARSLVTPADLRDRLGVLKSEILTLRDTLLDAIRQAEGAQA